MKQMGKMYIHKKNDNLVRVEDIYETRNSKGYREKLTYKISWDISSNKKAYDYDVPEEWLGDVVPVSL